MNCRRVQSFMSAYADSELPGIEMLAVRQHLSECTECRLEFESLLTIKRAFGGLHPKRPAPDLPSRIFQRLDQVSRPRHEQVLASLRRHLTVFPARLRLAAVGVSVFAMLLMLRSGQISMTSYAYIPLSPPAQQTSLAELNAVGLPAMVETASFNTTPSPEPPAQPWGLSAGTGKPMHVTAGPDLLPASFAAPR